VAAQLLGVPSVRLYQDSVFVKRPGGEGRPLFMQDNDLVRIQRPRSITNGRLTFVHTWMTWCGIHSP
jgi:hypothetical protein